MIVRDCVTNVDFPNVILKRAIYDDAKEALIVSTGYIKAKAHRLASTQFNVENLDATRDWLLTIDGANATYNVISNDGVKMKIEIEVDDPNSDHDIVLVAE